MAININYDSIEDELQEYIKNPTVLVNRDDIPYEYQQSRSRLKYRRYGIPIPCKLYMFMVQNHISKLLLSEFASGFFLDYIKLKNNYC